MSTSRVGGHAAARPAELQYLVGIRTGLAVSTLAAPRLSGRVFGIDTRRQPAAPYLARLFGIRNAVLALGLARLDAVRDPRTLLALNVGVDLADAASGLSAGRRGELSRRTTAHVVAIALTAAGLGASVLARAPTGALAAPADSSLNRDT